jgi:hypothetical protein
MVSICTGLRKHAEAIQVARGLTAFHLAEFVAQKNREQPETDRTRNHERARRRLLEGQIQEKRLHDCLGGCV